jgi:hypothetical protein
MTCRICHREHAHDSRSECVMDKAGRELCDLLDSGAIDPAVRTAILGAKGRAAWTPEAREIVRQAGS